MSSHRRLSREMALQALFQMEFSPRQSIEEGLNALKPSFSPSEEVWNYASSLVRGVADHREGIDSLIQGGSQHWKLDRMSLVDLNVMRIAVFETRFSAEKLPPAVAINEAVEVARRFGSVDSPAFVNGILDQIVKE